MSFVSRHLIFAESKKLIPHSTLVNALHLYNRHGTPDWAKDSIEDLVRNQQWKELNDRFYKNMTFGTGGIRGRMIGQIVTVAETGTPDSFGRPQHPAVGTNTMNEYNLLRAVTGLCLYVRKNFTPTSETPRARLVFAHDTRHFSREFVEMAARVVQRMGMDIYLFESDRPTPELSFAIRELNAQAGGMVTASHNPAHDNGFKAFYSDGAQIVEPHASGIIAEVNSVDTDLREESIESGEYHILGKEMDDLYLQRVFSLLLDAELVQSQKSFLKIVYSPLHGTGARLIPRLLEEMGFEFSVVQRQSEPDGRFPTVKSPNPEYSESLFLAMQQADTERADLVVATDPDTDRMGVAVRDHRGELVLLNGNQIASLIAYYRTHKLFEQGVLNQTNAAKNAALIKTVVTTGLLAAVAGHFGVKLVETLTGFKYIAAKLGDYEKQVLDAKKMSTGEYRKLNEKVKRDLLLKYGTYYIFGGEESYGYSASDFVRDKDAVAAVLMFCETAAFAKSKGMSLVEMLDEIYCRLGFFSEKLGQITLEGAEGAKKIEKLLASYTSQKPESLCGRKITRVVRYDQEAITDIDGKLLPKEQMIVFECEDGASVTIRGSGTEPEIKYYIAAKKLPGAGCVFAPDELARIKAEANAFLEACWGELETDAQKRMD